MFFPFSKNNDLSGLTPIEIWKIESLIFGVIMASCNNESVPTFGAFMAFLGEILDETLCEFNDPNPLTISRIGHDAVDAYLFMVEHRDDVKDASRKWIYSASEITKAFKEYPTLRDYLREQAHSETDSDVSNIERESL